MYPSKYLGIKVVGCAFEYWSPGSRRRLWFYINYFL